MPSKRRSRKRRGSWSIKTKRRAVQRADDHSFGSGLDEVGFRPLGRRILVSKQLSQGDRPETASETETESPVDATLGCDTSDPSRVRKAAERAFSGADLVAIRKEIEGALRRWKLRDS